MPRDNICLSCHGAYHDDQMGPGGDCIYCEIGVESDVQVAEGREAREPEPDRDRDDRGPEDG